MTTQNKCKHYTKRSRWEQVFNKWTGEYEDELVEWNEYHTQDIGIGAYRCTLCNETMYYTGKWQNYYEEGVPCPGSEHSEKTGDAHMVRAAIGGQL